MTDQIGAEEFLIELVGGPSELISRLGYRGKWPPPETITVAGLTFRRSSYSSLPSGIEGIVRGARYVMDEAPA